MFRLYILSMLLLFTSGLIFTALSSSTIFLASGLLQLSVGAGGLSAGIMSEMDSGTLRRHGTARHARTDVDRDPS